MAAIDSGVNDPTANQSEDRADQHSHPAIPLDVAGSSEEKAACESEPKGHKNQAKNNREDLGAFGWSGHSGIIELL